MFKSIMQLVDIIKITFLFSLKLIPAVVGISLAPFFFIGAVFAGASYHPNSTMKLITIVMALLAIALPIGGIVSSIYLIIRP